MFSELASIFFLFFRIGMFTVGGGLAIIPLVQQELVARGLLTLSESIDLISISEMTPGPFGINAATFTGMKLYGITGAVTASAGIVLPSFIICIIVARFFFGINGKPQVRSVLAGIRPVVLALIVSAMLTVMKTAFFPQGLESINGLISPEWPVLIITAAAFLVLQKTKLNPILPLIAAGIAGAFFLR